MGLSQYTIANETYVQSVLIGKTKHGEKYRKSKCNRAYDQKLKEIEGERFKLLEPMINQFSDEDKFYSFQM